METSFLPTTIPAAKLKAVEMALLETFGDINLTDVTPLKGGLSGSLVFKIAMDDQSYILKIAMDESPVLDDNSFNCLEIASQAGVAPAIFYIDRREGISITAFITNVPLRAVFNSPDSLLPELAKTIRQIHQMPLFEKENNLLLTVDTLVTNFRNSGMLAGPEVNESLHYFDMIRKHYPWHEGDNVSSHNDLNPSNITSDGEKIWVIDWDMASQSDRYVDLAIVANFFVHTDEDERLFLENYFGSAPDEYKKARFFLMRQTCRIIYAALMFKLADKLKPAGEEHNADMQVPDLKEIGERMRAGTMQLSSYEGQLIYGKAMINEALKKMQSPRFNKSLKDMEQAG
ncbi:phosphotransferase [Dyadobacter subterraneus]|uniref:Phosphotransferase n=1 Tax=Dyadobacter subterraneus TaxID=2773304 RepID=A0ABR9WEM0_9BACT|nr:phosphotransferase [Dyadobacter subterraneus]MBE9463366.1 phosphotransferase [Dyadobacter subterraneus]